MANTHSLDLERDTSQYASITDGDQTGLDITGDISIELWVKFESLPGAMMIVTKGDFTNVQYGYYLQLNASSALRFRFYSTLDGSVGTDVTADTAFGAGDIGVWMHLAVTADVSVPTVNMYKNGSSFASTATDTSATSIVNNTAPFALGCQFSGGSPITFFDGKMDEVRVYNRVLTATEIANNYQREISGGESGLQGYWQLDNDYTDKTSNGNDLTGGNSPIFSTDTPFRGGDAGFLLNFV